MKAIDVHGHYGNHDRGQGDLGARLRSASIEEVCERARAAGIALTVVSPLQSFHPYRGRILEANDDARRVSEAHDDIRFWAVLDPRRKETYRQVEELLAHPRCKGIKLHPVNHRYEILDYGDEVFEFAAAQRAVVLTHSGDPGSFPEDFIPFTNRHAEVTLILGHLGHSTDGNVSRQVYAIQQSIPRNVYVDTSSARSIMSGLIEWAVEQIGTDRILFGTDTPVYSAASQKARVAYAGIDEAAKRAIFYENAARLLDEKIAQGAGENSGDKSL